MLVTKIGNELAVRLTAEDASRLGLKEGDEVIVARRLEPGVSKHDRLSRLRNGCDRWSVFAE